MHDPEPCPPADRPRGNRGLALLPTPRLAALRRRYAAPGAAPLGYVADVLAEIDAALAARRVAS